MPDALYLQLIEKMLSDPELKAKLTPDFEQFAAWGKAMREAV